MGDIKSDCWVGLELSSPSAIGTIRFFPRGSCPGCQTGGNPACLSIQKEKGKCDEGGCRMSGGKFQGATSAAGPWSDLATIPTTVPVSEDSWSSLSSEDGSEFTHVRYMSAPLGYCNVAEVVSHLSHPTRPLSALPVSHEGRNGLGRSSTRRRFWAGSSPPSSSLVAVRTWVAGSPTASVWAGARE